MTEKTENKDKIEKKESKGNNAKAPQLIPFGNPFIRESLETLAVAIILAVVFRTFFLQAFYIPSSSMEDTLQIGDRIIVNKYIYKFRNPKRQEVLVFKFPNMPTKDFIKRLVGLPGETLKIENGALYVDSHDEKGFIKIEEPYIKGIIEDGIKRDPATRQALESTLTLGPDEYFVMGDNRQNSEDARFWGPLKHKYIKGRAACIYWPLSRMRRIK